MKNIIIRSRSEVTNKSDVSIYLILITNCNSSENVNKELNQKVKKHGCIVYNKVKKFTYLFTCIQVGNFGSNFPLNL